MRKGIKILGKVFSAAVLLLIILPVFLSLLLDIPAVQNFVVHKAAEVVSRKLETTVSIDRVDIGIFSKIKVKGFYVEDYGRDTLLYVGKLDAYVTGFGIFGGGLAFSRGEIADAKLYLRQMPDGEMNIKQIVSRISDPDKPKKGNFRLSLKRASIENMDLCLERIDSVAPDYGIDFSHMHLYGLTARVDDFVIDGSAIYTTIAALTARERSGFVLDHLAGRFYMTQGCLGFEDASIVTARSNIRIPYISLVGNSWAEYKDFLGQVRIEAALRNTSVSTDDIAWFAPKLRDWHVDFSNIDVEVAGVVSDFTAKVRSMHVGEGTTLVADAVVKGLPDIRDTWFDLSVPRLHSSAEAVDGLALGIAGRKLSDKLVGILGNSGSVDLNARFKGKLASFDMQLGAATEVGDIACNLRMSPLKKGLSSVRGDVETRNLRLGELLDRRDLLGNATLTAYVDGVIGKGVADANIAGNVTQLGFNGYVYDSLRLDGRLRNREFDGRVTARDPNLDFDFFGLVDFNDSVPRYDFTMDLRHADLARLHINRRDSVSQLSAHIVANAGGRSLDDLNGRIQVTGARYRYNDKEIEASNMTVTGENSERSKLVELRSDFADATFRSKTSYRTVFEYLRRSAWKYLPMLREAPPEAGPSERKAAVANDFSLLSVNIRNFNPVADAVSAGLQVADGSSLQLLFNPASDQLSLKASSEYIERRRMLATRLSVNASNRGDSLAVYASAEDLYAGVLHLPRLSLTGGARQGRVQLSAGFNDTMRRVSGLVGFRSAVVDEHGPNGRVVDLRILPSHITRGDKTWQIYAHKILIDTARIVIDKFFVMNREQELLLNGIASRSRADSVTLSLRNFDLSPFTQVAERMGYVIEGRTNGSAQMKSVLRGGEISADILFDSVEVNDIPAPPMRLASRWDFARNRAGVTVVDRLKRDTLVRGFYAPDQMRYYARVDIDSLDMGLLDPILTGVISSTEGVASADLVLQGQRREAELAGEIHVSGLRTKVDFTQVAYSMPEAVLSVKNNRFKASNVAVFDPQGHRGRFDFDMSLQHLSNISYDVRVAPQQMLVLDTDADDNDAFYGKVYATGSARISGDKRAVKMDIAASTDGNSSFVLPLSSKSNISNADFVVFVQPEKTDTLDNVARKKLLFERKHRQRADASNQMNITMALDVRPDAEVEIDVAGNTVKGRGEGTLNLAINPRANIFEIYGDYTISEGSFMLSLQQIINKRFTIESGSSIQWTGSPMNALLDIDAVYKLKASLQPLLQGTSENLGGDRSVPVECIIHLGDRLSNPSIGFDVRVPGSDPETQTLVTNALSTPETVDTQFLYLLLFNSFMSENSSQANANIGSSVSAATGLEFVSNMVSNWLSSSDYNVVIRYRPKSELTSDEVDFGLSKSLINNRLFVEVEGNYLIDNKQAAVNNNSMSNFMGEAYITYLIDRAGTLKLKAFTQTIDRFDENQGLQETGIGVYFKEDFNNLRDLRDRIRERFTNKKRKARRMARRTTRAAEKAAEEAEKNRRQEPADTLSPFGYVKGKEDE
ncbi:translocation/assembly module TamB domain-containing protein [Alistipes provencensis]|uniref:translocation/assembly module TamB domain-containing protein n=1 Tax=Alistipes provencensis TaxID=1816676 RepID=UPI0007ED6FCB|nr:translocation/assembly module TamB domain-containing protein [Alistipes provencensis]